MSEKKLKNPIEAIRNPESINKEYSDLVTKLGLFDLEIKAIQKARSNQGEREDKIQIERDGIFERIDELHLEMNEAQKEIQRKEELAKKEKGEEAIQ